MDANELIRPADRAPRKETQIMSRIKAPGAPIVAVDWSEGHGQYIGKRIWFLEVRCPYCAGIHHHSGGVGGKPSGLGHRVSHCQVGRPNDGYIVTDPDHLLATRTS
jgi:hypothetical protein